MLRKNIVSTIIKSIGYTNGTLQIEFRKGQVYSYNGVPAKVYKELMKSPSPGRYFIQTIKGTYEYQQV